MVKRRRYRRGRGRSFRRTARKIRSTRRIARKAYRIAKIAAKSEPKFNENKLYAQSIGSTSILTIKPFAPITEGTSYFRQRIGDTIKALSFSIRGRLWFNTEQAFANQENYRRTCRIIVFWVKQPRGASFSYDQFFDTGNQYLNPYAMKLWTKRDDITVIYNKIYQIDNFHPERLFDINIRLRYKKIQWEAPDQLFPDNTDLYCMMIGSDPLPVNPLGARLVTDCVWRSTYIDP